MSPWALSVLSAFLLLSPWLVMPARRLRPEIHGYLRLLWWINAFYCAVWHRFEARGMAPLPEHGPAILIANHTSGVDPTILQASCRRVLGFMIAREFYENWAFHPMCRILHCIPVQRDGRDTAATRAALRALDEGRVVPVFPEGRIIPESGRVLGRPKPGAAFLVLHARVPVIPAYIWGTPPTNNVVQGLLTPSRARVLYGEPLDLSDIDSSGPLKKELLAKVSERLMGAIQALKAEAEGRQNTSLTDCAPPAGSDHARRRPEADPGSISRAGPALLRA